MTDYLFRGKLAELDQDVFDMAQLETERQNRKLIMIPSESTAPTGGSGSPRYILSEYLCRRLP